MTDMAPTQMHVPSSAKPRSQAPAGGQPNGRKKPRNPWLTATLIIWLLFLSIVAAGAVLQYKRDWQAWQESAKGSSAQETGLAQSVLAERIESMDERLNAETSSLRESAQADLGILRKILEEKTAAVTEQMSGQAAEMAEEIATIREQVKALETRLATERQTVAASNPDTGEPPPAKRPLPSIKPPFQVIGVEQRGFERFLAVMRQGSQSVADIQLMRVGTRFGAWLLEAIEEGHAVFRVEDAVVRLPIPRLPVLSGTRG
jgi:uncharacterized coiled-coil protein SlyX